jgi:hypothetical protein
VPCDARPPPPPRAADAASARARAAIAPLTPRAAFFRAARRAAPRSRARAGTGEFESLLAADNNMPIRPAAATDLHTQARCEQRPGAVAPAPPSTPREDDRAPQLGDGATLASSGGSAPGEAPSAESAIDATTALRMRLLGSERTRVRLGSLRRAAALARGGLDDASSGADRAEAESLGWNTISVDDRTFACRLLERLFGVGVAAVDDEAIAATLALVKRAVNGGGDDEAWLPVGKNGSKFELIVRKAQADARAQRGPAAAARTTLPATAPRPDQLSGDARQPGAPTAASTPAALVGSVPGSAPASEVRAPPRRAPPPSAACRRARPPRRLRARQSRSRAGARAPTAAGRGGVAVRAAEARADGTQRRVGGARAAATPRALPPALASPGRRRPRASLTHRRRARAHARARRPPQVARKRAREVGEVGPAEVRAHAQRHVAAGPPALARRRRARQWRLLRHEDDRVCARGARRRARERAVR